MARYDVQRKSQLLLALLLLAGCDQSSVAGEQEGPRPVKSAMARAERSAGASFPGIVAAKVETDLAFRTLGRVISRTADVGDLVRKGDILAEIDPLALQLAVTSAEADLRNAEAQFENAAMTEKRKRGLASTSAASIADLDLAEEGLKSAEAGVQKARASLDKARDQLGYARLKAEFDGVVTATSVEAGQTVTAGQAVLKLARLEERDVVIDIPEAQLGLLRLGTPLDIALQLDTTIRTSGIVREIAPEADADTRTHRLKIALADAPEVFRLGSVVTATVTNTSLAGAIGLPASAIVVKNGAENVWVIDPTKHTVSLRPVRLDARADGDRHVRIVSGLREGESVAVAGVNALAEGQEVRAEQEPRQ